MTATVADKKPRRNRRGFFVAKKRPASAGNTACSSEGRDREIPQIAQQEMPQRAQQKMPQETSRKNAAYKEDGRKRDGLTSPVLTISPLSEHVLAGVIFNVEELSVSLLEWIQLADTAFGGGNSEPPRKATKRKRPLIPSRPSAYRPTAAVCPSGCKGNA